MLSKFMWKYILLFLALSYINISLNTPHLSSPTSQSPSYQLTPKVKASLTLGYNNLVATMLWFKLINDFDYNAQSNSPLDYAYLASQLNTIVEINPNANHAYYMAATLLPWATNSTQYSAQLLDKAIQLQPNEWQWAYYRGFNSYWFDHNYQLSAHYLDLASTKPNAPKIVKNLALRMHAQAGTIDTALTFLAQLIHNETEPQTKKELLHQYTKLKTEKQIQNIEALLKKEHLTINMANFYFLKKHYKIPDTLADGGHIIQGEHGTLTSSKTTKRFKIFMPPSRKGYHQHDPSH